MQNTFEPHILIVNPFSSPQYLSSQFREMGIKTTALYTYDKSFFDDYTIPKKDWFDQQLFINHDNDVDLIADLKKYQFNYILNGSERSALLTDKIAEELTPDYANKSITSIYRSDKVLMHEILKNNNLNHIEQFIFDFYHEDINKLMDIKYPCFIKPLNGVLSHGATKINSFQEMKEAFSSESIQKIFNKIKLYANKEDFGKFIIGEYVTGEEYVVDTFSVHGSHVVSSIQKYEKKLINGVPMCRSINIVTDEDEKMMLKEYVCKCLSALQLDNGFAHVELFLTEEKQPVLIEVNCRISGLKGYLNYLAQLHGLNSQTDILGTYLKSGELLDTNRGVGNIHYKILSLFNFAAMPFNVFKEQVSKFSSIQEIIFLKDLYNEHNTKPISSSDVAAVVVCSASDSKILSDEVNKILAIDEYGVG